MKTAKEIQSEFSSMGINLSEDVVKLFQLTVVLDVANEVGNTYKDPAMALNIMNSFNEANMRNRTPLLEEVLQSTQG